MRRGCRNRRAHPMPCPGRSKSRHARLALLLHYSCAAHMFRSRWRSNNTAPFKDQRMDRPSPPASTPRHVAAAALAAPGRDAASSRTHPSAMCPALASGRFHRTLTREPLARAPRPGPPAPRSTRRGSALPVTLPALLSRLFVPSPLKGVPHGPSRLPFSEYAHSSATQVHANLSILAR